MAGNSTHPGLSVVSKAVNILGVFSEERTELALSDLARATAMPTSTVHRLVQELVECGALERTAAGRYVIGLRLWGIAARSPHNYALSDAATPYMQQVLSSTHGHVHLAALHGHGALVLEKLSWPHAEKTISRTGSKMPLHASAAGLVLLAYAPSAFQEAVLAAPLNAFTPQTTTDPFVLRRLLAVIRQEGVSRSMEQLVAGMDACAAPVFWPDQRVAGAIAGIAATGTYKMADMERAVRKAAKGLTDFLATPESAVGSRASFHAGLRPMAHTD
ncbi:IclR family transcriptional regulator [Arthrobacter sp. CDRTa11]|uniref:IclR family transcriptional regulator n=1 Tax=Arthrobacter sp. CDRTa11 TaxID=2651199 RepID=UPI002265972F|nr:IclR family transcriptional regulator [Arthrobacter sp. CDRTa11]UZX03254.1 IclR family transcriptional regulator [Arthrobacter sp. CDRTa11]